jgi:hypothetical protein
MTGDSEMVTIYHNPERDTFTAVSSSGATVANQMIGRQALLFAKECSYMGKTVVFDAHALAAALNDEATA